MFHIFSAPEARNVYSKNPKTRTSCKDLETDSTTQNPVAKSPKRALVIQVILKGVSACDATLDLI
jgi:hypothetical protein